MNNKEAELTAHFGQVAESMICNIDKVCKSYKDSQLKDSIIEDRIFNLEILSSEIRSWHAEFQITKDTDLGEDIIGHFEKIGNIAHSIILRIDDLTRA